ncbi:MAG: hypothetical protein OQK82_03375 [Candidatus Pacearchaeota archaeon]|nr:hypothetical protein [Candidatus Pacearchaeota archaeon]
MNLEKSDDIFEHKLKEVGKTLGHLLAKEIRKNHLFINTLKYLYTKKPKILTTEEILMKAYEDNRNRINRIYTKNYPITKSNTSRRKKILKSYSSSDELQEEFSFEEGVLDFISSEKNTKNYVN